MSALYNENDPFAAEWLEHLITHGHIAQGSVDRRSIVDLTPADVAGPGQRHFFAGIGGWSYALRRAGVADDADVWTGSCPCQPFSDAGQGRGVSDPRHLWPAWVALIRECRPPVIFGEQVASRDGLNWLDLVFADLERCGYAVGAADLCAAGVGAPHIRQRMYFVAQAHGEPGRLQLRPRGPRSDDAQAGRGSKDRTGAMANADGQSGGRRRQGRGHRRATVESAGCGVLGVLAERGGATGIVEHASGTRGRGDPGAVPRQESESESEGRRVGRRLDVPVPAGATRGPWADADWILCRSPDGGPPVARPVEPGTFPLASGVPGRVGLLRGYGNAITTEVAVTFIRAALGADD